MKGYRVLHPEHGVREESFNFCSFQEGYFPHKMRDYFHDETETKTFFPTKVSFLNSEEWQKFDFDEEEEEEILKQKDFLIEVESKSHQKPPEPDSEVTPPWVEDGDFPSR